MPRKFRLSDGRKNSSGSRTSSKESLSHPSLCALKENIHSHGELPYGIALASYSLRKLLLAGHGLIGVHAGWVLTSSCSENIQMCQIRTVHHAPTIYYTITIKFDFSWTLLLCGREVKLL